jgi:2-keto-3-deoxy-L-rhamnonate aldolase RhmA
VTAASAPAGLKNPAKERMQADELALGLIVRVARCAEIARIAAATGHDFLFIDAQHAPFSPETVSQIALAAHGSAVAPIVRVRGANDPNVPLFLDAGAAGIIVPDVNSAEDARRAARAAKFAPLGRRSLPGPMPLLDFGPVPAAEAARAVNDATLLVCMIETRAGLENAEAIAAVEGVDVVHVGCVDLAYDLGEPDGFGGPATVAAVERVIAAARQNGKFAGVGGDRDPERLARYVEQGVRFMTTQTDAGLLMAEGARVAGQLRRLR